MHIYFPHAIIKQYNKAQFNHQKTRKPQAERILAQPVAQVEEPRPGESPSLRRVLFTQARVRESGTGSSARSRLDETLACSKLSESPGRPFAREGLGELLLTSPRRDKLAWASLTVTATVVPTSVVFFTCQQQPQPFHAFTATYQFKDHKNILQNSSQSHQTKRFQLPVPRQSQLETSIPNYGAQTTSRNRPRAGKQ